MKEFEYPLTDILLKGLRRFPGPRNAEELEDCHNLMPMEERLNVHEQITDMDADGITWDGLGKLTVAVSTKTITVRVSDYLDDSDLQTVTVWLDGVNKGTTDANGELDIANVAVGGHTIKLTKASYTDSDLDDLLNDYIVVT